MFFLKEPSDFTINKFIASQRDRPFTYSAVGETDGTPPEGFIVDHNRIQLGHGKHLYEHVLSALQQWEQFDLGWVSIVPKGVPIEIGATVAVKARAFGTWSLNATRIVYVVNERNAVDVSDLRMELCLITLSVARSGSRLNFTNQTNLFGTTFWRFRSRSIRW
jgi:hypothetical protein